MRCAAVLLASAMALFGGHAMAGVVVSVTEVELSDNKPQTTMIYVDNDRMKVVGGNDTMIYRGDLKRMWTINNNDHSYTEITPETIQQMKGRMAQAQSQMQQRFANMSPEQRAQMQAAMAQLPPEQRARMQAMMGGAGGGLGGPPAVAAPPADRVNYVKAGGGKAVSAWRCESYAKTVNGKKEEDVCVAPIASVGLVQGDFKVLQDIGTMFGDLGGQARRNDYMGLDAMNKAIGFQGIPLETISYSDNKPERRSTVNKIDRTAIPASTFELPQGLRKEDINFGPPGH